MRVWVERLHPNGGYDFLLNMGQMIKMPFQLLHDHCVDCSQEHILYFTRDYFANLMIFWTVARHNAANNFEIELEHAANFLFIAYFVI